MPLSQLQAPPFYHICSCAATVKNRDPELQATEQLPYPQNSSTKPAYKKVLKCEGISD